MRLKQNCCDGVYNSFDVHFTSACDNKCAHCIDLKYDGFGINKPNVKSIVKSIIDNQNGYDDILFLILGNPYSSNILFGYYKEIIEWNISLSSDALSKIYFSTQFFITCFISLLSIAIWFIGNAIQYFRYSC